MFDIGGWEFLLIGILGIIIIGPKELPGAIRTVSMFVRRARGLARDFQSGLEDMAREAELDKLTDDLTGKSDPDSAIGGLRKELEDAVDPEGKIRESMEYSSDWKDDDLIDYDDPEFAEDNKMHSVDGKDDTSGAKDGTSSETADESAVTAEVPPKDSAGGDTALPEQKTEKPS
tara:strand:+ start:2242 stop:2763 length:522 start_codon:yes stop_codon:yes gene_type:complete